QAKQKRIYKSLRQSLDAGNLPYLTVRATDVDREKEPDMAATPTLDVPAGVPPLGALLQPTIQPDRTRDATKTSKTANRGRMRRLSTSTVIAASAHENQTNG